MEAWRSGRASYAEVEQALIQLIDLGNVESVMAALPEEWHRNMLDAFRGFRDLSDAPEYERLAREEVAPGEESRRHFMEITLPAIKHWLSKHDPG